MLAKPVWPGVRLHPLRLSLDPLPSYWGGDPRPSPVGGAAEPMAANRGGEALVWGPVDGPICRCGLLGHAGRLGHSLGALDPGHGTGAGNPQGGSTRVKGRRGDYSLGPKGSARPAGGIGNSEQGRYPRRLSSPDAPGPSRPWRHSGTGRTAQCGARSIIQRALGLSTAINRHAGELAGRERLAGLQGTGGAEADKSSAEIAIDRILD